LNKDIQTLTPYQLFTNFLNDLLLGMLSSKTTPFFINDWKRSL